MRGREALHRDRQDRAHPALGVALGLLLDLAQHTRAVVARLVLDALEQLLLGLAGAEPADALQRRGALRAQRVELGPGAGELALALGQLGLAAVELGQPPREGLLDGRREQRRAHRAVAGDAAEAPASAPGGRSRAAAAPPPATPASAPCGWFLRLNTSAAMTMPAATSPAAITTTISVPPPLRPGRRARAGRCPLFVERGTGPAGGAGGRSWLRRRAPPCSAR